MDRSAMAKSSADSDMKQHSKELERLQREIRENEKKSENAAKRERTILSQLEDMDHQLKRRQRHLAGLQKQIRLRDEQIAVLREEADQLQRELARKERLILERLRSLYKEGISNNLSIMLSAKNVRDMENRMYYLQWDAKRQQELFDGFRVQADQLSEKQQNLESVRISLNRERSELKEELRKVRREGRRKRMLLASVQNKRENYEKVIKELNEASHQLQNLLQELERERSERSRVRDFMRQRGRLSWPNNGDVVGLFGRHKHPKFDTFIYRKGIEIRPNFKEDVQAVYDGRVMYADWFRGYGMVIILDHGESYYTLYAHLARVLVKQGESVKRHQTVGTVGETGFIQENRLYFEIRHQGKPVDPLVWLKKR